MYALAALSCLAQALLPLFDEDPNKGAEWAKQALGEYQGHYVNSYAKQMRAKLGLKTAEVEDQKLIEDLLKLMASDRVDFTILFRRLSEFHSSSVGGAHPPGLRDLFMQRDAFDHWASQYKMRLLKEASVDESRQCQMRQVNPKYILRNYLAEQAIRKAEDDKDYSEIDVLFRLLQNPFAEHVEYDHYAEHPPEWANGISVSCSS